MTYVSGASGPSKIMGTSTLHIPHGTHTKCAWDHDRQKLRKCLARPAELRRVCPTRRLHAARLAAAARREEEPSLAVLRAFRSKATHCRRSVTASSCETPMLPGSVGLTLGRSAPRAVEPAHPPTPHRRRPALAPGSLARGRAARGRIHPLHKVHGVALHFCWCPHPPG